MESFGDMGQINSIYIISIEKKWFGFQTNCFLNSLMGWIKFKNQGATVFASQIFRRWEELCGVTAANVERILFQRGWR